jgi:hypothetical protein
MEAVRKIIEHSSGSLTIEVPKEYDNRKLEVIVMPIDEDNKEAKKKYDFSDLAGKLEWKGDALKEQRKLRDEWE